MICQRPFIRFKPKGHTVHLDRKYAKYAFMLSNDDQGCRGDSAPQIRLHTDTLSSRHACQAGLLTIVGIAGVMLLQGMLDSQI